MQGAKPLEKLLEIKFSFQPVPTEEIVNSHFPEPLTPPKSAVLLLHAPTSEPDSFNEVTAELRRWISEASPTSEVFDLSDENRSEEIASEQEDWLLRILERSDSRVVVVNSPSAVALSRGLASENDSEAAEPLTGSDDPLRDLRRYAFREVTSRLAGDYKRTFVASLSGHKPVVKDLENLTPLKQCLLPEQLGSMRAWLRQEAAEAMATRQEDVRLMSVIRRFQSDLLEVKA